MIVRCSSCRHFRNARHWPFTCRCGATLTRDGAVDQAHLLPSFGRQVATGGEYAWAIQSRWRAVDDFIAAHCQSCGRYPCLAAKHCQHRDALALGEDCPNGLELQPAWCAVDRIAVVTCHFNPCGYRTPRENYERFAAGMAAVGARLHTVELAFDDDPFDLADAWLRVRGTRERHLLWQKERLLNLAIQALPNEIAAVCWIDADVIFENPRWLKQAAVALNEDQVIQLFDASQWTDACGDVTWERRSAGWAWKHKPADHANGNESHTGFAWAGRADWLRKYGLYDRHITGGGDSFMLPAFTEAPIWHMSITSPEMRADFENWSRSVYSVIGGRFGYVRGKLRHLFHGSRSNRQYVERWTFLRDQGYDPTRHVRVDDTGLLAWTDEARRERPDMVRWVADYFALRREDG